MSSCTSISAKRVFTGHDWFYDHTIKLENGVVKSIIPSTQPAEIDIVAPSFIDLQLYGAGGYLFSEYPSTNTLDIIYQHCLASGTAYFMPTLATNSNAIFKAGIQTVQSYWKGGGKGCLGLHLEGPWINPENQEQTLKQIGFRSEGANHIGGIRVLGAAEFAELLVKSRLSSRGR